jgi:hypothetical protein
MVYAASGNILHRPFPRFVAAFWVVAAPLAESTHTFGPNMVAPLQFVELYGLFWALLWTPARPWARVVRFTFAVACCLSTFLAVLFLPLALLRIWACRDRASVWLASVLAAGGAFQTAGLVLGVSSRGGISHPRLDPLWALVSFADWGLPFGVAGEKIMRDPGFNEPGVHSGGGGAWYWAGVVVTWLIVLAVLAVALRRTTSPYWLFAAVAWSEAVLLLCAQIVIQGRLELRYAYAPAMIVVAALLALLRPRTLPRHAPLTTKAATWLPVLALVCVLAVSAAVNYRTWTTRSLAVPWSTKVAESTAICRADRNAPFVVTFTVDAWFVVIPCRLLR